MKYQMTMAFASKAQNEMMRHFDMKPDCKWYVQYQKVSFETSTLIDDAYFMNIIEKSKGMSDGWIPFIDFCGNYYFDPSVKILSDGKQEMFITPKMTNEEGPG